MGLTIVKMTANVVLDAWIASFRTLRNCPRIFIPFIITAFFEFIALLLIYYSPRQPLVVFLGPPITRFWGGKYLHYPFNFVLMPKLLFYSQTLISIFVGSLMTAVAVYLIWQSISLNNRQRILPAIKKTLPRYLGVIVAIFINLILIWLYFKFENKFENKLLVKLFAENPTKKILFIGVQGWRQIGFYFGILVTIIIDTLFVYVIPIIIIERRSVFMAIIRSITFAIRNFTVSFFIVAIPILFYLPIIILKGKMSILMDKFIPEVTLYILTCGILLTMLINCWITALSVHVFITRRKVSEVK
ncbi:MAG: hypothetical protein ABH952_10795 [Candidatus Omnitrophota bacterium]